MIKKWLILVSIMGVLSACGGIVVTEPIPTETSEPIPASTPQQSTQASTCMAGEWSLEFHRSGGFAGFDESLTLNSDGKLVVDSNSPQVSFERTIPADEIQRIADQLEAACPFEADSKAGNCADCFGYTLTVKTGKETYRLSGNDTTLTDEQSALVSSLQQYFTPSQ